jgi:hypothetical protein
VRPFVDGRTEKSAVTVLQLHRDGAAWVRYLEDDVARSYVEVTQTETIAAVRVKSREGEGHAVRSGRPSRRGGPWTKGVSIAAAWPRPRRC